MTGVRDRLDQQAAHERRRAVRALLTSPLLHADRDLESFRLVRRHADELKRWFAREAGWTLTVDTTLARLRKVPATLDDGTRPARARRSDPPFSRRRYVLLCLALATLETSDPQVALGKLAGQIVGSVAADPQLAEAGIAFQLETRDQRRDLVAVVRLLMELGVLRHVDGSDTDYVAGTGDALYTVDRAALTAVLATRRAPSGIDAAGLDLDGRLAALVSEVVPDTPDARNRTIRSHLIRRLLDDPVVYHADLDDDQRSYLTGQRARLVSTITEATGLEAEVRAEGIAMVDERGDATDLEVPDQGTDGHLTLLVAEDLARRLREAAARADGAPSGPMVVTTAEVEACVADRIAEHAAHWRRDVRDPGAEVRLAAEVLDRLAAVGLVHPVAGGIMPRAAIARYAVAAPSVPAAAPSLFEA
ncbi:MAG: TIGR02678 family protein [Egicoccus sp.]